MNKKLVRNNIPRIIENATGSAPKVRTAQASELPNLLIDKIHEEANEAREAINSGTYDDLISELCDIHQALIDLASNNGISLDQIEIRRDEKEREKGSFSNGFILEI